MILDFQDESSMDCIEGSSDVSGGTAINLSSRPSSAPTAATAAASTTTTTTAANCNNTATMDGEIQEENVSIAQKVPLNVSYI